MTDDPVTWHPVATRPPPAGLPDPGAVLARRLAPALDRVPRLAGAPVAVAVGSRGMPYLPALVAAVVGALRRRGAEPFLVPAMGSHAGGTAAGQAAMLRDLGLAPNAAGAPVVSRPGTGVVGFTPSGYPVWSDHAAWTARYVVPVHRVKPHTAFRGAVESGPSKLLAVGLGKAPGARAAHREGLARFVPEVARFWLAAGRVPAGVATVDNARGEPAEISVLTPADWHHTEARLLRTARALMPRLPWDDLDLLVVQEIGKDVSGTGMDLHVIGLERRFPGCGARPRIRRIVASALTPASHGNANGVGYADRVTRRLAGAIDWEATRANARTTGFGEAVRLPPVDPTEAHAVAAVLEELGLSPATVRAVRIRNTACLDRFEVSPALLRNLPAGVGRTCGQPVGVPVDNSPGSP